MVLSYSELCYEVYYGISYCLDYAEVGLTEINASRKVTNSQLQM